MRALNNYDGYTFYLRQPCTQTDMLFLFILLILSLCLILSLLICHKLTETKNDSFLPQCICISLLRFSGNKFHSICIFIPTCLHCAKKENKIKFLSQNDFSLPQWERMEPAVKSKYRQQSWKMPSCTVSTSSLKAAA